MSYLKHKPGSIEEMMANNAKKLNDSAYQQMFKKELEKAGKGIGAMSPKEKKDFFNKIDSKYKAKDEGFASDAQRKAAFASGYKAKDKKETLDNKDKSVVKDVVGALKKATKAHAGQAKDLEKAMKTEADQHGDEINQKKLDKVKADKKVADSGSKVTKVETEPKVDYKN
jgi:hypothetical protein